MAQSHSSSRVAEAEQWTSLYIIRCSFTPLLLDVNNHTTQVWEDVKKILANGNHMGPVVVSSNQIELRSFEFGSWKLIPGFTIFKPNMIPITISATICLVQQDRKYPPPPRTIKQLVVLIDTARLAETTLTATDMIQTNNSSTAADDKAEECLVDYNRSSMLVLESSRNWNARSDYNNIPSGPSTANVSTIVTPQHPTPASSNYYGTNAESTTSCLISAGGNSRVSIIGNMLSHFGSGTSEQPTANSTQTTTTGLRTQAADSGCVGGASVEDRKSDAGNKSDEEESNTKIGPKCGVCGKVYVHNTSLRRHVKKKHPFSVMRHLIKGKCRHCRKEITAIQLTNHERACEVKIKYLREVFGHEL